MRARRTDSCTNFAKVSANSAFASAKPTNCGIVPKRANSAVFNLTLGQILPATS
jgi:hypothetical protein